MILNNGFNNSEFIQVRSTQYEFEDRRKEGIWEEKKLISLNWSVTYCILLLALISYR